MTRRGSPLGTALWVLGCEPVPPQALIGPDDAGDSEAWASSGAADDTAPGAARSSDEGDGGDSGVAPADTTVASTGAAAGDSDATTSSDAPTEASCGADLVSGHAIVHDLGGQSGACALPDASASGLYAAVAPSLYADASVCGACARVVGPRGAIDVAIVDRCSDGACQPTDLALDPAAHAAIAGADVSSVAIEWHLVPCDTDGPIRYRFDGGSNPWWAAVQVLEHRHAIASLEFLDAFGTWHDVPRTDWNYFVAVSGMGAPSVTLRVTDVHGATLEDELTLAPGDEVAGHDQFPPCE